MTKALPIWRREAWHLTELAARRAPWREGRRMEISSAMIPITTRSSTRVKAFRVEREVLRCIFIRRLQWRFVSAEQVQGECRDTANDMINTNKNGGVRGRVI